MRFSCAPSTASTSSYFFPNEPCCAGIAENVLPPVLHERIPVTRREFCNPKRVGLSPLLEEDRHVPPREAHEGWSPRLAHGLVLHRRSGRAGKCFLKLRHVGDGAVPPMAHGGPRAVARARSRRCCFRTGGGASRGRSCAAASPPICAARNARRSPPLSAMFSSSVSCPSTGSPSNVYPEYWRAKQALRLAYSFASSGVHQSRRTPLHRINGPCHRSCA